MLPKHQSFQPSPDTDLLDLSRRVLRQEGFLVQDGPGDFPVLLAENPHFVLAVVATTSVSGFPHAEDAAIMSLATHIPHKDPGPKKWDVYIVMLTRNTAGADNDDSAVTHSLYEITYDHYGMRRITHVGVEPTPAGVRDALANFFALPTQSSNTGTTLATDPLSDLRIALRKHHVNSKMAERALTLFRSGIGLTHEL